MLAEHRDEPVFLFLHTYQVHDYAPDEAAAKKLFPDLSVMGPDWRDSIGLLTRSRLSDPRLTGWIRARYDAAVCMYHDQALIPIKTVDFEHGVNVTLGLDFVRTSPDHGTAFDIAGEHRANPASLIAALELARAMGETRAARR